jgi:hypothetical protein
VRVFFAFCSLGANNFVRPRPFVRIASAGNDGAIVPQLVLPMPPIEVVSIRWLGIEEVR